MFYRWNLEALGDFSRNFIFLVITIIKYFDNSILNFKIKKIIRLCYFIVLMHYIASFDFNR